MAVAHGVQADLSLEPTCFLPDDIIIRDVCVIGGGSSGTYTATRLRDSNKSVVVLEQKNRIGGHTETYRDPDSGSTLDLGVITTSGRKLILAKKIVSTVPHQLECLHNFDLSINEESLFAQFYNNAFYTRVLRGTSLPTDAPIGSFGPKKPYNVPDLPGIYALNPHLTTALVQVYYGSPHALPEDQIRADIITVVQRIQKARSMSITTPEFVAFANHTPFNMMVSCDAIRDGFYKNLYGLQGQRHTFYNGATFHTQDSSVLWRFTEQLLPRILADS